MTSTARGMSAAAAVAALLWFAPASGAATPATATPGAAGAAKPARRPQVTARDKQIEARIRAEVDAASPKAAAVFERADAARDAGRFREALTLYQQAEKLAPKIDHSHRRVCEVLDEVGRTDEAVTECETALRLAPDSAYDASALALALSARHHAADADRALALARKAVTRRPGDIDMLSEWCVTAARFARTGELQECVNDLLARRPNSRLGNYLGALVAGAHGDLATARARLDRAHAAGLADATYRDLSAKLDKAAASTSSGKLSRLFNRTFWLICLYVAGIWLGTMALLFAAGWILSRLTLRNIEAVATQDPSGDGTPRERRLRRVYRVVIFLCGIYFYLSVPFLLGSVVILGGGFIYGCFAFGYIPVKLVVVVGLVVIFTIIAVVRGLFATRGKADLGLKLDLAANPRLRDVLGDVARAVGTRPVDSAYLTAGTDMAVTERGELWKALRGATSERCLIMGVGLLDGMRQIELRSVLAHEYGHFRNQDTAGGGFALAVRRSLVAMIVRLARSGVATAYNPVWRFLRGFHRVYLVVSQGASRLQEVLADRWAVRAYGSEAFVRGYSHVVSRSVAFDRHVQATLKEVIDEHRPLPNLYRYQPELEASADKELSEAIDEAMRREPSPYDSHPAPRQRIAWARAMAVPHRSTEADDEPVWDLLADREAVESRLTARVRESVEVRHGVEIAAAPPASDA